MQGVAPLLADIKRLDEEIDALEGQPGSARRDRELAALRLERAHGILTLAQADPGSTPN